MAWTRRPLEICFQRARKRRISNKLCFMTSNSAIASAADHQRALSSPQGARNDRRAVRFDRARSRNNNGALGKLHPSPISL
jgi:hypothetical protein